MVVSRSVASHANPYIPTHESRLTVDLRPPLGRANADAALGTKLGCHTVCLCIHSPKYSHQFPIVNTTDANHRGTLDQVGEKKHPRP